MVNWLLFYFFLFIVLFYWLVSTFILGTTGNTWEQLGTTRNTQWGNYVYPIVRNSTTYIYIFIDYFLVNYRVRGRRVLMLPLSSFFWLLFSIDFIFILFIFILNMKYYRRRRTYKIYKSKKRYYKKGGLQINNK